MNPGRSLSNNAFPLYVRGKVVALVLTVSLVSAPFVNEPHRATKFLSVLFQSRESRRGSRTTVCNNKSTRTPLTHSCCAQPSLSSVDWTCLDRVWCDVPNKKDKDFFIVYEIWKTVFKVFGIVTKKWVCQCSLPSLRVLKSNFALAHLRKRTHWNLPPPKMTVAQFEFQYTSVKQLKGAAVHQGADTWHEPLPATLLVSGARLSRCPTRCWIVNAARCIATYTFRWFSNYILNLDELFHLADKCVVLLAAGGQAASASRGEIHPTANQDARCAPLSSWASTSCKRYYSELSAKMNQHLFNQAHPLKQLIRLAGIQSHRLFGDAGAISCVNFSIYSAALLVRDGRWLLSTVYCTDPAHPDSVQIPVIDANNAGKCRLKTYACKCLCLIFELRISPVSPKKSRAPCLSMNSLFRCLVFVRSLIFLSFVFSFFS